ncbi:MAG: T9SS type A sorting domain-containing protein [Bacteroidales bacterium]|nr:T9SS type A sorting domain-containing protein [Bacteroidales bacterium]
MKKFLLLIAAVVVTMTASAQSKTFAKSQVGAKVEKQKLPDFLLKAKTVNPFGDFKKGLVATPKKQMIQSREGEIDESKILTYWSSDDTKLTPVGMTNSMPSEATEFRWGVSFSKDLMQKYIGNTIDRIVFYTTPGTLTNCSVWVMSLATGKVVWQQACSLVEFDINAIACENPYTITGEPVMVGYTAYVKSPSIENYPVASVVYPTTVDGAAYWYYGGGWLDASTGVYEDSYAAFYLECLTSGEAGRKNNDLTVLGADGLRGELSAGNQQFGAYVRNYGMTEVSSFDYTYEVDGNTTSGTVNLPTPLGYLGTKGVAVTEVKPNSKGIYNGTFTVTKVNGGDDGDAEDNVAPVPVVALDGGVKRMNVIEEWTSTECGWCPRGVVGLDKIKNNYKNDVIPISVHTWFNQQGDDVLDVPAYEEVLMTYASSFPGASINREYKDVDPYYNFEDLPSIFNQHCEATLGLATSDEDMGASVSITPSIEFNIDVPAKYYGLAYVITEDNITGVDQLNYYYGKPDSYFKGIDDLKFLQTVTPTDQKAVSGTVYYYYQPTFNDIARTIDSPWGDKHLLPACKAGEKVTLDPVVIEMPSSIESSKTDDVNVTALLIDQRTGIIVTASRVKFNESGWAVGINKVENATDEPVIEVAEGAFNVTAENATAKVYTMDGKLVTSATVKGSASIPTFGNGAYIIRVEANGQKFAKKAIF